jgi:hypothetical protein
MTDYPDARKFYFDMSFERRIEFKRRMQKFYHSMENQGILDKVLKVNIKDGSSYWNMSEDEDEYESENDDSEHDDHHKQGECNDTIFSDDDLDCSKLKLE